MTKKCTTSVVMGYIIHQIRLETGLKKQSEFGEMLKLTGAAVGKIERGESSVSLDFLLILSALIGTKASAIIEVLEKITESLVNQNIMFIEGNSTDLFQGIKNDDTPLEPDVLPSLIENFISLELKKEIRALVTKRIVSIEEQIEQLASQLDTENQTTNAISLAGVGVGALATSAIAIALGGPVGVVVGTTLLASRFQKNKKAP